MTITVNGPNGVTINFPDGTDSGTIESVMSQALGAPKQQIVGFGERDQREAEMPLGAEGQYNLDVAKTAARKRRLGEEGIISTPKSASGAFQGGAAQNLSDEMAGLAGGAAGLVKSAANLENPISGAARGYQVSRDAERMLQEEYAKEHPILAPVLNVAGGIIAGPPMKGSVVPSSTWQGIKEGAKGGAALGGLQGFGAGEGLPDSLIGFGTGAVGGGIIGGGVPAAGALAGKILSPITNSFKGFRDPKGMAAREIVGRRGRDAAAGQGMSDAEFNALVAQGEPVAAMDLGGENMMDLARRAADLSAEGRQAMKGVTDPRYATQGEQLRGALQKESALAGSADDAMDAAAEAGRRANNAAYKDAFAKGSGNIWTPELERLASSPTVQKALKTAIAKSADDSIISGFGAMKPRVTVNAADELVFTGEGGLPAYPDIRLWDATKRELDRMAKMAARNSDSDARIYKGLAAQLRNHLVSLPGVGKAYGTALETAATKFGAEDAFSAGRNFAQQIGGSEKMSARDALKATAKMKPEERKLFREGYIAAMQEKLKEVGNTRNATLGIMQSDGAIERARVALGKDGAVRLQAKIEVQKAMQLRNEAINGGSKTARYLMGEGIFASAAGGATALGGGDPRDITIAAATAAATKHGHKVAAARVAKEVGKLLASKDPAAIERLGRLAAQSPKFMQGLRAFNKGLAGQLGSAGADVATR